MANEFDNTALNSTVRELWDERLEDARYAEMVIGSRVANKSEIAKKKGDIIHVTIDQAYTVGTVSAAGVVAAQNYTLSTVDITLQNWEQITIVELDRAKAQSFWLPDSVFPKNVGKAFGARYDSVLAGQHASITSSVGSTTSPADLDKTLVQEAMLTLANSNVPLEDLNLFVHPTAYWQGLFNEVQLQDANKTGSEKSALITGKVNMIAGVPIYQSTNIASTGSPAVRKNLLLHKSCMAIAWQKDAEIKSADGLAGLVLGTIFNAQSLYGYNVIRADHGVVINSKA